MCATTATGRCIACQKSFRFHPDRVGLCFEQDSMPHPVCNPCLRRINPIRLTRGRPEIGPIPGKDASALPQPDTAMQRHSNRQKETV
jgi:hypothetical protein